MVITEPWEHIVIDNYYDADVFKTIQTEAKRFLSKNIDRETRKQAFPFPDNELLKQAIESNKINESYFDQLTYHRPYSEISLFWEVNFLRGPHRYPIHDEAQRKVLSCVVYVDPIENSGTRLYDKNKKLIKEIEWKPNRALIFAAQDDVTWHDYHCPRGSFRVTINQFLERPRDEQTA
tara:strand:- start:7287 stop:7820 length:534 start_codon:yes stop_codon:yes gene_type:complete